jgi:hypothetical protein
MVFHILFVKHAMLQELRIMKKMDGDDLLYFVAIVLGMIVLSIVAVMYVHHEIYY